MSAITEVKNNSWLSIFTGSTKSEISPAELAAVEELHATVEQRVALAASTSLSQPKLSLPDSEGMLTQYKNQIELTLNQVVLSEDVALPIRNFCRKVISDTNEKLHNSKRLAQEIEMSECQKVLDSVKYLLRVDLKALSEAITTDNPKATLIEAVKKNMQEAKNQLESLRAQEDLYLVQSAAATYANQLPLTISKFLITEFGLALGLVDAVKEVFIPPQNKSWLWSSDDRPSYIRYLEMQLDRVISFAGKSPENYHRLQTAIMSLNKPRYRLESVNELIRSMFGLKPNDVLTNTHARICALADLLSEPRQIETGTCFVERQQIWTNAYRPDLAFNDTSDIFSKGGMVKLIDGELKVYKASNQIADWELENYFLTLGAGGRLANRPTELFVWDAPGIQRALNVIGIVDSPELREETSEMLMKNANEGLVRVSVEDVLNAVVIIWLKQQKIAQDPIPIQYRAYFAFSSMTHSPLQRVKIEMLAQMIESNAGGQWSQAVDACVASAFRELAASMTKEGEKPTQEKLELEMRFTLLFMKIFSNMRYWTYENLGDRTDRPEDGNEGQWILRAKDGSADGMRMNEPKDFQAFLSKVADTCWKDSAAVGLPTAVAEIANDVLIQMKSAVNSSSFVERCFKLFCPVLNTQQIEDPLTNWKEINYTPIRIRDGGGISPIVNQYFDTSVPIMTQFKPKSALDALNVISEFCRNKITTNPGFDRYSVPMGIPGHAVNFYPEDKIANTIYISHLIQTGQSIISQRMPVEMAEKIRGQCLKLISDPKERDAARTEFKSSLTPGQSLGGYCNKLLNVVLAHTPDDQKAEVTTRICNINLANLPKNDFMKITSSAGRVFDLNWSDEYVGATGEKEVHALFGMFYFDPTIGDIQLGSVGDDRCSITSIQNEFLGHPGEDVWGAYFVDQTASVAGSSA